jgi:hypothetical protein
LERFLLVKPLTPVTSYLTETVSSGFPDWMFLEEQTQYESYAKRVLMAAFAF